MRLVSLQIRPRGTNGWGSGRLEFGQEVTQLFGPNGCGKTPLMQAMVYCLGFPCKFRNDIYERCENATLEFELDGSIYFARRTFLSSDFEVELAGPLGIQDFFNERDYSEYLFELLRIDFPNLVTTAGKSTTPYISSVLPLFYLDQDDGYGSFYSPPNNFVKDQLSEVIRLLINLPPRNSFDAKKDELEAKRTLDYLDRLVLSRKSDCDIAKDRLGQQSGSQLDYENELSRLKARLDELRSVAPSKTTSVAALDEVLAGYRREFQDIEAKIDEIDKRGRSLSQIISEIQVEINTLNLNEEARRAFTAFGEVCANKNCGLFALSSDSYGKNLLYLRDQIKDLERNASISQGRRSELIRQLDAIRAKASDTLAKRKRLLENDESSSMVEVVSQLATEIFNVEMKRREVAEVKELEARYFNTIVERDRAVERVSAFTAANYRDPKIIKTRSELRTAFVDWMDVLDTNNVSRDISFRDEFIPIMGSEAVGQLKGSTKIRAVLAYHAALFQILAKPDSKKIGFMILDTPKQHEMHDVDLARYLQGLKEFAGTSGVQVIFSGTEYHYQGDKKDKEWSPKFPGKKNNMFLGNVN